MAKYFELWDADTRNMIATFDTPQEAQSYLRRVLDELGRDVIEQWGLLIEDDEDETFGRLIEGADLSKLAYYEPKRRESL